MPYSAKDFEINEKPDVVVDDYVRQRPNSRALRISVETMQQEGSWTIG